jgi:hypothetical protein
VKDADDFVEHVFHIARAYRTNHELDSGAKNRAVRRSLRVFHKHATALALWLESAHKPSQTTAEFDALSKIGVVVHGAASTAQAQSLTTRSWLKHAAVGSVEAEQALRGKQMQRAPQIAAEAVRATFERHKLKLSYQATQKKQSDAVALLCAIAKDAGDASLTLARAKEWLKASGARS